MAIALTQLAVKVLKGPFALLIRDEDTLSFDSYPKVGTYVGFRIIERIEGSYIAYIYSNAPDPAVISRELRKIPYYFCEARLENGWWDIALPFGV